MLQPTERVRNGWEGAYCCTAVPGWEGLKSGLYITGNTTTRLANWASVTKRAAPVVQVYVCFVVGSLFLFFSFFVQKDDEENKHRKGKKRERCCSSNTAVQTAPKPRHTGMDACKNTARQLLLEA